MYSFLSQLSQIISEPISTFLNVYDHSPIIIALLLGLIGAVAPCQLTGNISAITLYGNRTIQVNNNWGVVASFIAGKVAIYCAIGLLAWLFGQSIESKAAEYFPLFRKAIGPLLMMTGLTLFGFIKFEFLKCITFHIPFDSKKGKLGSFLLGATFAIAFCPTMFVLFFVWLMPIVTTTSYGLALPAVFGVATSIPLIIILGLIRYFDVKGFIMRRSRKVGGVIQKVAGIMLIIIGVLDSFTYWDI